MLTLAKLRHDLNFSVLRILFGIHETTCARYFKDTLKLLASVLEVAVYWPDKKEILNNMPACFNEYIARLELSLTVQKCQLKSLEAVYGVASDFILRIMVQKL